MTQERPPDPNEKNRAIVAYTMTLATVGGQVGCLTLVIIGVALFAGLWLDRTFDTKPMFTLLLVLGSIPVTIVTMFLAVRQTTSRMLPTIDKMSTKQEEEKKTVTVAEPRKRRFGFKRWIVLGLLILSFLFTLVYPPILPHIQLPAERLFELFPGFYWTNTMTAMVLADIVILILALFFRRAVSSGKMFLTGILGAVEALLEVIYNLTETTAGKWAKRVFPYFAAITLYLLIVNWMELIPGVDSIGLIEHAPEGVHGYQTETLFHIGSLPVETIVKEARVGEEAGIEPEGVGSVVVPFVRVLSTDLNFTVALALFAVFMVQVFGYRAQGSHYFNKFFNLGGIFKKPVFGVIDFGVGILELISEISKILSFSFRLFGNIFAGSVLLFVIGTLVPVLAQSGFLMLEFFVGLIQAVVFGMLTMVFIAQATQGHESSGTEEAH